MERNFEGDQKEELIPCPSPSIDAMMIFIASKRQKEPSKRFIKKQLMKIDFI